MNGGSVFIEGVAGTGKTTLAQGIIERMRSLGKKCLAISKTHVASSKIDGNTADSFVRRRILAGRPGIAICGATRWDSSMSDSGSNCQNYSF